MVWEDLVTHLGPSEWNRREVEGSREQRKVRAP